MLELTREDVFELYLEPAKEDEGEVTASMTTREQAFYSLEGQGYTWLQVEKAYQDWSK